MKLSGKVIKILANFYYVKDSKNKAWECFARSRLLKEGKLLFVGDDVEIETSSSMQGVITDVKTRNNKIDKPPVANINQVLVVFSTAEPELDLYNLDRYLSYIAYELPGEEIRICLNKIDLKKINLDTDYKNCGYDICYVSALTKEGINKLAYELADKTTVLTGPSGVGKSSLIKSLAPELEIEIGEVSSNKQGKHKTRNVQLISVNCNGKNGFLIDTPGFTQFSFAGLSSQKLLLSFKDLNSIECGFSNCLHNSEEGCNVPELIEKNKISAKRYDSYLKILFESQSEIIYKTKQESKSKSVGSSSDWKGKKLPKIDQIERAKSRKRKKQELLKLEDDFEK